MASLQRIFSSTLPEVEEALIEMGFEVREKTGDGFSILIPGCGRKVTALGYDFVIEPGKRRIRFWQSDGKIRFEGRSSADADGTMERLSQMLEYQLGVTIRID